MWNNIPNKILIKSTSYFRVVKCNSTLFHDTNFEFKIRQEKMSLLKKGNIGLRIKTLESER